MTRRVKSDSAASTVASCSSSLEPKCAKTPLLLMPTAWARRPIESRSIPSTVASRVASPRIAPRLRTPSPRGLRPLATPASKTRSDTSGGGCRRAQGTSLDALGEQRRLELVVRGHVLLAFLRGLVDGDPESVEERHVLVGGVCADLVRVGAAIVAVGLNPQLPRDLELRVAAWRDHVGLGHHHAGVGLEDLGYVVLDQERPRDLLDVDRRRTTVIGRRVPSGDVLARRAPLILLVGKSEDPVGEVDAIDWRVDARRRGVG